MDMKKNVKILGILLAGLISCSQATKNVLRYARWTTPEELEATQQIIKEFEKEHPDIKVKIEYANWGSYWDKLQTEFAAGTAPDVFLLDPMFFFDFLQKKALLDLTDYISEKELSDMWKGAVEVFKWHGRIYALPRDINTTVIYYNKDIFDERGVPYPKHNWTWEEFLETAKKLTFDKNQDGKPDVFGYIPSSVMETCWAPWVWSAGGEILDKERKKCLLSQPKALKAFEFLYRMVHIWRVAPSPARMSSLGDLPFKTGQIAMISDGSWMVQTYYKGCNFKWDIVEFPRGEAQATSINGVGHAINPKTKNLKAAILLVKFLSSQKAQKILAKTQTSIPVLKSVALSPVFLDAAPKIDRKVFLNSIKMGRTLPFTPKMFKWTEEIIPRYLDLMFMGKMKPSEAIKRATKEVNQLLEEIRKL